MKAVLHLFSEVICMFDSDHLSNMHILKYGILISLISSYVI